MNADKMPPLPKPKLIATVQGNFYSADQMHTYARAYAETQTREMVEALRGAECALSLMHSYGHCERDSYTGARDVAQVRAGDALERISALIAKHKATREQP